MADEDQEKTDKAIAEAETKKPGPKKAKPQAAPLARRIVAPDVTLESEAVRAARFNVRNLERLVRNHTTKLEEAEAVLESVLEAEAAG